MTERPEGPQTPAGPTIREYSSEDELQERLAALEEQFDEEVAELKQQVRDLKSELEEKAEKDHSARQRASIRRRVHEAEERLDNIEGQVHYGKEKRLQILTDRLIESADGDGRAMLSADDITDEFDVSPRTARNYMADLADRHGGMKYRRVDPMDASTPKRLYFSLEQFVEASDEYEFDE